MTLRDFLVWVNNAHDGLVIFVFIPVVGCFVAIVGSWCYLVYSMAQYLKHLAQVCP